MFEIIPNWHPVFAHFTVAMLGISVVLFLVGAVLGNRPVRSQVMTVARWNLWLGALITIGTVLAGFNAFNTVEHGSELQHQAMIQHRNWALPTAALFILLATWTAFAFKRGMPLGAIQNVFLLVGMSVAGVMLATTGYKGGELVFRHGIGVMAVNQPSSGQSDGHAHGGEQAGHYHAEQNPASGQTTASAQLHEHTEAMDSAQAEGHEESQKPHPHASYGDHEGEAATAERRTPDMSDSEGHAAHASGRAPEAHVEPAAGGHAGMTDEHQQHAMGRRDKSSGKSAATPNHKAMGHEQKPAAEHQGHEQDVLRAGHGHPAGKEAPMEHGASHAQQQHGGHEGKEMDHKSMSGFYGSYPMTREASGTSWVPDSSPMEGMHGMFGKWMTMTHGYVNLIYDHQGGRRGDNKTFSESMLMVMAQRKLGAGTFGLRGMFSLDPLMGKDGYPLLLQTGETANGVTPLIDRQHPHDLLMELAATYSAPLGQENSIFGYIGYPGEPALGPPTFMHRFSGMDNPEAPLGHHWLDSTHITFGVATLGYVHGKWKVEASAFNGREPDEERWNFDEPHLNSASGRVSYNPTPNWSMQLSHGHLDSPEQLEPEVNQRRTTASVSYNRPFDDNNWQTTLAWGRNDKNPGSTTDAVLLESALKFHDTHTVFGRAEYAEKDELFEAGHPLEGQRFDVGKLSLGYIYDIPIAEHVTLGLGGLGSIYALPDRLDPFYGENPASVMLFARMKLK